MLETKESCSAIRLKDYRTQEKDPNKQILLDLQATQECQAGLSARYNIERKFAEGFLS